MYIEAEYPGDATPNASGLVTRHPGAAPCAPTIVPARSIVWCLQSNPRSFSMYHRNDLSLDGFSTCHSNLTHLARGEKLYLTISVPPPAKCSWKYILFNSVLVLVRKNISYPRTRWVAHFFDPLLFQCSATDVHLERKGDVCWGGGWVGNCAFLGDLC